MMFFGHNQPLGEGLGYGYLYNWHAASDVNFAPIDWKLPTQAEYNELRTTLGGESVAGGKMKESGLDHWKTPNTGADNSSGFAGFGAGFRDIDGTFYFFKEETYFWTIDAGSSLPVATEGLNYDSSDFFQSQYFKEAGDSVRLLYTGAGTPTTVTDNDGNVYDVVQIGTQYWTVQNWRCTTLSRYPFTTIPNVTDNSAWAALTTLGRCAYDNDESNV